MPPRHKIPALEASWIEYWQQQIRPIKDGGHIAMPLRGVIYRIDKTAGKAYIVAEVVNSVYSFRGSLTDQTNTRLLEHLGFSVERRWDCTKSDPASFIAALDSTVEGKNFFLDDALLEKMAVMFVLDIYKLPRRYRS